MDATKRYFSCAPLFRIWDPIRRGFGFANERPENGEVVETWTGRFDREGCPVYEQDIVSIHHDWELGWVRALVVRQAGTADFVGQVTGPEGVFYIGAFEFAEGYIEGNFHQHPQRLLPAAWQFPDPEPQSPPWWWSSTAKRRGETVFGARASRKELRWVSPWSSPPTPKTAPRAHQPFLQPALPTHHAMRPGVQSSPRV